MGNASQGGVTFNWVGNQTTGNFVDGPLWIDVGAGSIGMDEPLPAQTVNLGETVNGAMINPVHVSVGDQGWCGHSIQNAGFTDYVPSLSVTSWPLNMSAGDVLVKARGRTDAPGSVGEVATAGDWAANNGNKRREGVNIEYGTVFTTNGTYDSETFAPLVVGAAAGGFSPWKQTLYPSLFAAAQAAPRWPTASFAGNVPTFTEAFTEGIDVFAFNYGMHYGATTGTGYQAHLPYILYNGAQNYGVNAAAYWGANALLYISDAVSNSQKVQILTRMLSAGYQWHMGHRHIGKRVGGNGAHHQFGFIPAMFYLAFTQGNFNDMLTYTPYHQLGQTFYIDQSKIDNELTPFHSNSAWAFSSRARQVTGVNGNDITVQGGLPGDDAPIRMKGAIMVRQSDNARVLVTNTVTGGTLTIQSHPSPTIQVGDVVMFDYDEAGGFAVGQGHWGIGGRQTTKNWGTFTVGTDANYRKLQYWADSLILCEAMGWTGFNGYDGFKAYVEACNNYRFGGRPTPNNAYPWEDHYLTIRGKHFGRDFWSTHYAAIEGSTPPQTETLPSGSVNVTVNAS